MSVKRRRPTSDISLNTALGAALKQQINEGANSPLTSPTADRLVKTAPQFSKAMDNASQAEGLLAHATIAKNAKQTTCSIYARHGMMNISMAVERGDMPAYVLKFYKLDESNPILPPTTSEQDVVSIAHDFVKGEELRVADGGTALALPSPTAIVVQAKLDDFLKAIDDQNTAAKNLKDKQKDIRDLDEEGNAVIGKVWDELDTFYNEEPDSTRRDLCRLWGVVYISDNRVSITGIVLQVINGQAIGIENASLLLVQSDDTTTSKTNGLFELKTGYSGPATITISAPGLTDKTIDITISGEDDINLGEITMG